MSPEIYSREGRRSYYYGSQYGNGRKWQARAHLPGVRDHGMLDIESVR